MSNKPEKTGLLDPRQKLFWDAYVDPESSTFNNIRQSALAAGFAETTADKIGENEWFKGRLRRLNMRVKGETVLDDMLDLPVNKIEVSHKDKEGNPVQIVTTDSSLVKIKQDTAKFVVERLGKEDWSTRQELSGPGGGPLIDPAAKQKGDNAINEFLGEGAIDS